MEALDQLLMACHSQSIKPFVESFLHMVAKLLESREPDLQVLGTNSVSGISLPLASLNLFKPAGPIGTVPLSVLGSGFWVLVSNFSDRASFERREPSRVGALLPPGGWLQRDDKPRPLDLR